MSEQDHAATKFLRPVRQAVQSSHQVAVSVRDQEVRSLPLDDQLPRKIRAVVAVPRHDRDRAVKCIAQPVIVVSDIPAVDEPVRVLRVLHREQLLHRFRAVMCITPTQAKVETVDLFAEEEKEETVPTQAPVQQVEQVREEPHEVVASEAPKKKTVKVTYVQEELAVAYIPVALDEKQAVLLEQDLLERDPELKKGEAKFYARHCTKGKKYTIAQYKKSLRCAYETARTSMDHLAELLYYRKEKIKNKYVYIPVERE